MVSTGSTRCLSLSANALSAPSGAIAELSAPNGSQFNSYAKTIKSSIAIKNVGNVSATTIAPDVSLSNSPRRL